MILKVGFFGIFFNTASSAAPQIPRILGLTGSQAL
jgi:hypothetical protein